MNSSTKNLITTKEAKELSGYTADYIAKLVRAGAIVGERDAHTWLIDRASLNLFLEDKKIHKIERAKKLSNLRSVEYREHRRVFPKFSSILSKRRSPWHSNVGYTPLHSHAFALSIAVIVVAMGAVFSRASVLPQIGVSIASVAQESASGFHMAFGDIPARISSSINTFGKALHEKTSDSVLLAAVDSYREPAVFGEFQTILFRPDLTGDYQSEDLAYTGITNVYNVYSEETVKDFQTTIASLHEILSTPYRMKDVFYRAHSTLGESTYRVVTDALASYYSAIETSGPKTLSLIAAAHESLSATSRAVGRMNMAIGYMVIDTAHGAIRLDVALAHTLAEAAPVVARGAFVGIGTMGDTLASIAEQTPAAIAGGYLMATAAPAHLSPMLASVIYGVEYKLSVGFVNSLDVISREYLAHVDSIGRGVYAVVSGVPALLRGDMYVSVPANLANVLSGATTSELFKLSAW